MDGQLKTGRDVVIGGAARGRGVRLRHGAAGGARLRHDARLPPQHLPGRRGHAGPAAAREVHRRPGPRRQLHALHRPGGARADGRSSASARSRRWSAAATAWRLQQAVDHWKARGLDFSPIFHQPDGRRRASAATASIAAGPRARRVARQDDAARRCAGRRWSAASRSSATLPIRNINRVVGTILGSEVTRRYGAAGPAGRHDPAALPGLGRPELRRLRAAAASR